MKTKLFLLLCVAWCFGCMVCGITLALVQPDQKHRIYERSVETDFGAVQARMYGYYVTNWAPMPEENGNLRGTVISNYVIRVYLRTHNVEFSEKMTTIGFATCESGGSHSFITKEQMDAVDAQKK